MKINWQTWQEDASSHLSPDRLWQEVANFSHSIFNLCLSSILLQDAVDVADSHLAYVTETTGLEASLVHYSWGEFQYIEFRIKNT